MTHAITADGDAAQITGGRWTATSRDGRTVYEHSSGFVTTDTDVVEAAIENNSVTVSAALRDSPVAGE